MMDVIGFGAINLDETYAVPALAAMPDLTLIPGSEQTLTCREYNALIRLLDGAGARRSACGGGQAANTLYALARLGFETAIIATVGADDEGARLLAELAPVDVSAVVRGGRTARCVVIAEESGERTLRVLPATDPPALDPLAAWRSLGGARCLHLTSLVPASLLALQIGLVSGIAPETALSFDPGELYCRLGVAALTPLLRRTDVLFLNEREAEMLTGQPAFEGCSGMLQRDGALVVGKRGSRGVEIIGRGERFALPAREVAAVDPTGAGDVFAAGFLAGLLLDLDVRMCASLGVEAAASSVTGLGRSSYPGPELLESLGLPTPGRQRAKGVVP